MTTKRKRTARVVDTLSLADGTRQATVMIGDQSWIVDQLDMDVAPGDIFLVEPDAIKLSEKIGSSTASGWLPICDGLRWRTPNSKGQTRFEGLRQRHVIRRAVRDYFDGEDFIEIDTPLLVRGTTPDAVIQSFSLEDRYLITSSEYQIKRLEVGGFDRIYTLTQNFRRADRDGAYRNPEFTMLEWARCGQSLSVIEEDAERLILHAHGALGKTGALAYDGHDIDLTPPFDRLSVADAVKQVTGVANFEYTLPSLAQAVAAAGLTVHRETADDTAFLFSLLVNHIQPTLGLEKPVFLRDWPAFESSSAPDKIAGTVADRSELFVAGLELGDGFPSLTSYQLQRANFDFQLKRRREANLPSVAVDENYLAAMAAGLPQGAGMTIGFDRLVMLLTGRPHIRDVLAFSWNEV